MTVYGAGWALGISGKHFAKHVVVQAPRCTPETHVEGILNVNYNGKIKFRVLLKIRKKFRTSGLIPDLQNPEVTDMTIKVWEAQYKSITVKQPETLKLSPVIFQLNLSTKVEE